MWCVAALHKSSLESEKGFLCEAHEGGLQVCTTVALQQSARLFVPRVPSIFLSFLNARTCGAPKEICVWEILESTIFGGKLHPHTYLAASTSHITRARCKTLVYRLARLDVHQPRRRSAAARGACHFPLSDIRSSDAYAPQQASTLRGRLTATCSSNNA